MRVTELPQRAMNCGQLAVISKLLPGKKQLYMYSCGNVI